jgi:hypothetical protein
MAPAKATGVSGLQLTRTGAINQKNSEFRNPRETFSAFGTLCTTRRAFIDRRRPPILESGVEFIDYQL